MEVMFAHRPLVVAAEFFLAANRTIEKFAVVAGDWPKLRLVDAVRSFGLPAPGPWFSKRREPFYSTRTELGAHFLAVRPRF